MDCAHLATATLPRHRRHRLVKGGALLCLSALLAACTASPESQPPSQSPAQPQAAGKPVCDASRADHFIGQYVNGYIEREATRDAGASSSRTLAPDSAATMDFNPGRLNIYTDPGAVIIKMACG